MKWMQQIRWRCTQDEVLAAYDFDINPRFLVMRLVEMGRPRLQPPPITLRGNGTLKKMSVAAFWQVILAPFFDSLGVKITDIF